MSGTNKSSASGLAYEHIADRLRTGSLKPGEPLVNRKLAAEIGTSTIPLREAICRLASEGVLELNPGGSARVRTVDAAEICEIYDLRQALEVMAIGEAAMTFNDGLSSELQFCCDRFSEMAELIPPGSKASAAQLRKWLGLEERFHSSLLEASNNRWLNRVARNIRFLSVAFTTHLMVGQFLTGAMAREIADQHRELLAILGRRDVAGAQDWMCEHIRVGRATILRLFAESHT